MNAIIPKQLLALSILSDAVTAVTGCLIDSEMRLFQNPVVFGENTVIGDLTEANYTGYAEHVLVWDAPSVSDDGDVEVQSDQATFRPTGTAVGNDIYGFFFLDGSGALTGGGNFDGAPLPMNSPLDVIKANAVIRVTPGGLVPAIT